jgi:FixJ family two-component response regulator
MLKNIESKPVIYIVDDDDSVRKALKRRIESYIKMVDP